MFKVTVSTLLICVVIAAASVLISLSTAFTRMQIQDPFTAYADIIPGQYMRNTTLDEQAYGCDCVPGQTNVTLLCNPNSETEPVIGVAVVLRGFKVVQLDLILREGALSIGDAALLWGSPEIKVIGQQTSLKWPDRCISGISWSFGKSFSYFQSVRYVSLVGRDLAEQCTLDFPLTLPLSQSALK